MGYWRNQAKALEAQYSGVRPGWVSAEISYYLSLAEARTLGTFKRRGSPQSYFRILGLVGEDYIKQLLPFPLEELEELTFTQIGDEDAPKNSSV